MNPFRTHGAISWSEYLASDVDQSLSFFQELVGWSTSEMPMDEGTYNVLEAGGTDAAGLMACPPGAPPCWGFYVTLDDIADWIKTKQPDLLVPMTDTMVGTFAGFKDPQGAYLSVIQYKDSEHSSGIDSIIEAFIRQGHFAWFELQTHDPSAAAAHYADLFGWTISERDIPSGKYYQISVGEAGIGGILPLMAPDVPPHWYAYVTVDDVDAIESKAASMGATITATAFDVPGVGRLMHLLDPNGVPLAFATWDLFSLAQ